jgi:hypothetical protein
MLPGADAGAVPSLFNVCRTPLRPPAEPAILSRDALRSTEGCRGATKENPPTDVPPTVKSNADPGGGLRGNFPRWPLRLEEDAAIEIVECAEAIDALLHVSTLEHLSAMVSSRANSFVADSHDLWGRLTYSMHTSIGASSNPSSGVWPTLGALHPLSRNATPRLDDDSRRLSAMPTK